MTPTSAAAGELTSLSSGIWDEHDAAVQPADREAAVEPAEGHAQERGRGEVVGKGHQGKKALVQTDLLGCQMGVDI